jgi:predicted MPP superfamily phosphohydrolase
MVHYSFLIAMATFKIKQLFNMIHSIGSQSKPNLACIQGQMVANSGGKRLTNYGQINTSASNCIGLPCSLLT